MFHAMMLKKKEKPLMIEHHALGSHVSCCRILWMKEFESKHDEQILRAKTLLR